MAMRSGTFNSVGAFFFLGYVHGVYVGMGVSPIQRPLAAPSKAHRIILAIRLFRMTVTALLFASFADALNRESVELTLPAGATVSDALSSLRALPGGDRLPPSPLVAINLSYVRADAALSHGDEVAVIPPVAGG